MTSGPAGLPPRESFPPRTALPRDVIVPTLPGLGTTWYDGGPRYRARRALLAFMWALVTALITLLTIGLLAGIKHSSTACFTVVLAVEVVYSLGILVFFAIRTRREWDDAAAAPPGKRSASTPGRAKSAPGQLLLIPSFLFVGLYLAMLMSSLMPQTLVERRAWLSIAGTLREHGHLPRA